MTFRIAVICLGNICRSPMAHVVLDERLRRAGLDDRVEIVSGGTGDWHVGQPMDRRAAATLSAAGYDPSRHRARTVTTDWYAENDLLLVMDGANHTDLLALAPTVGAHEQVRMFRSFDPQAHEGDDEVPDPYTGGDEGFRAVLATVERTCDAIVEQLPTLLPSSRSGE